MATGEIEHCSLRVVGQITFATNDVTVMTTTKAYDYLNRLTNISSLNSQPSTINSFAYQYNPASQRTSVTNVDGSYWVYSYDTMGQVTSGKKYWSDGSTVAGQQFDYTFDDIGNRQSTTRDTRTATYWANGLNQYSSRTVPGFVNVLGTATNTATVSLWSPDSTALYTPTTRKGDYFRGEMPFNNSTGAMWLTITNVAVLNDGTNPDIVTNVVGNLLLAKNSEPFTYDADGNLTGDSLWTNVWNGENRRVTIESRSTLPAAARRKVDWTILADGRWVERIVSTWNPSTLNYQPSTTNRYVWDNQVLLAVLDHTNGVVVSFMRGLDLSGSLQGAGGVGGVLAVQTGNSAQCDALANSTHFACYDGNGNVTALMDAATGEASARYEYAPFAEKLRETGPMARLNPIRFSTQYADDVTGDAKYLFRDYQADVGRWLSRDPLGEETGINLFGIVANNPLGMHDVLGLWGSDVHHGNTKEWAVDEFYPYDAAEAVGAANAAVDGWLIFGPTGPMPWGDQSYHFNRNTGSGDSRLQHTTEHITRAQIACSAAVDNPEEAAKQLGTALHPLQDWVAHGDYFIKWVGPITKVHNESSLQDIQNKSGAPDDPRLDAVGGPDGRPAGNAMKYYNLPSGMRIDYAVYQTGSARIRKTQELTVEKLKNFRSYVTKQGGCKCKRYFGVQ